jgi:hypothetical protein
MDPKLTILFLLIGSVIALSYLTEETLRRMRLASRRLRYIVPGRRRA